MIIRPSRLKELKSYLVALGLPLASSLLNSDLASLLSLLTSGGFILKSEVKRLSKRYEIAEGEIIKEEGIIRRLKTDMSLRNVVQVKVKQSPMERLLRYGDLIIHTKSNEPIKLSSIGRPKVIAGRINELLKE